MNFFQPSGDPDASGGWIPPAPTPHGFIASARSGAPWYVDAGFSFVNSPAGADALARFDHAFGAPLAVPPDARLSPWSYAGRVVAWAIFTASGLFLGWLFAR